MRVGIVGVGFMGSTHAMGWAETDAIIAGFTAKPVRLAEPIAAEFGAKVYPDFEALLEDVDIVDICTPTFLHHEMVLRAAQAGKQIVCEKPLSLTVEQGREMVSACRKVGVKLLVGHVVRFFPEYAAAKSMVESGQIGKPAVLHLGRKSFHPKKTTDNWFLDDEKSGGMIQDLMVHDFDYARWIAGDVVRVFAKSIHGSGHNVPGNHALAILTHQSGAISHIEGSWAYPPPNFKTDFEIACADGLIVHNSDAATPNGLYLKKASDEEAQDVALPSSPLAESPYTTQIKAFYRAIVDDADIPITAEDGLAAVQIARAAIESARTGKAVELEPLPEVAS